MSLMRMDNKEYCEGHTSEDIRIAKLARVCRCYDLLDWQAQFFVKKEYIRGGYASGKSFIFMLMYTVGEIGFDEFLSLSFQGNGNLFKNQIKRYGLTFKGENERMIKELKNSDLKLVNINNDLKRWGVGN